MIQRLKNMDAFDWFCVFVVGIALFAMAMIFIAPE
jgi:hypothetical protein